MDHSTMTLNIDIKKMRCSLIFQPFMKNCIDDVSSVGSRVNDARNPS